MRRTEYLITELRNSTDNKDSDGIADSELIAYFNYGQKLIQNIVFKANPKCDLFKATKIYEPSSDGIYILPDNCLAENAISLVETESGGKVDRIDKSEAGWKFGYYTEDKTLKISGHVGSVRVTYFKTLPKMDKRWGKILALNAGVSLELDSGYDADMSNVDDHVSVVNRYGAQVISSIFIDSYADAVLNTTSDLTGAIVGDYICMGKDSVNASLLPESCETYLLDYVRQRVYTRNNYSDANKQVYFTDKQEADIADLFRNNQKDNLYPPITDTDMLEW